MDLPPAVRPAGHPPLHPVGPPLQPPLRPLRLARPARHATPRDTPRHLQEVLAGAAGGYGGPALRGPWRDLQGGPATGPVRIEAGWGADWMVQAAERPPGRSGGGPGLLGAAPCLVMASNRKISNSETEDMSVVLTWCGWRINRLLLKCDDSTNVYGVQHLRNKILDKSISTADTGSFLCNQIWYC